MTLGAGAEVLAATDGSDDSAATSAPGGTDIRSPARCEPEVPSAVAWASEAGSPPGASPQPSASSEAPIAREPKVRLLRNAIAVSLRRPAPERTCAAAPR